MGAQGSTTIDFGAFPGSSHATVDVVAAGVVAASLIEAWVMPVATADHSADEHIVETVKVVGAYVSDGNIRIHGLNTNQVVPPPEFGRDAHTPRQPAPRLVGLFTVGWCWN